MGCPKGYVTVADYWRTAPRRKPKAPEVYWTCERNGRTCGVRHRTESHALRHSIRLDKAERRAGRRAGWEPEKVERRRR